MSTPFYDLASLVLVPSGYKAQKVYAQKPLTTDGQLTFSRASTATRVNSAGLIETVSSNVPRLDYQGSTCPKLLLEPQRVNYSKGGSNATQGDWVNNLNAGTALSYTASGGLFTDGYSTITGTSASGRILHTASGVFPSATWSLYIRKRSAAHTGYIELAIYTQSTGNNLTIQANQLTTDWKRFSVSVTGGTGTYNDWSIFPYNSVDFDFCCMQTENGAYPTSYIPTTTAAVTRLADACSKTGISSLIGQTEGVFFLDFVASAQTADTGGAFSVLFTAGESGTNFQIYTAGTNLRFYKEPTTIDFSSSLNLVAGQRYKVAYAYKAGQYAFYANGVQLGTSTNGSVPAVSSIYINRFSNGTYQAQNNFNQVLLFKTRLTNAQLAELTTL